MKPPASEHTYPGVFVPIVLPFEITTARHSMVYEHDYYNHIERSIARYLVFIQNCYPTMPQIHKTGRLSLITNSNLLSQLLIVYPAEREENLEPPSPPSQVTPLTKKSSGFS